MKVVHHENGRVDGGGGSRHRNELASSWIVTVDASVSLTCFEQNQKYGRIQIVVGRTWRQAGINWDGCEKKDIRHKNGGTDGGKGTGDPEEHRVVSSVRMPPPVSLLLNQTINAAGFQPLSVIHICVRGRRAGVILGPGLPLDMAAQLYCGLCRCSHLGLVDSVASGHLQSVPDAYFLVPACPGCCNCCDVMEEN